MNMSLGFDGKPLFDIFFKDTSLEVGIGIPTLWVIKNGKKCAVDACGVFDNKLDAEEHMNHWLDWAILTSPDRKFFVKGGFITNEIVNFMSMQND